jgi:hypothetical protein
VTAGLAIALFPLTACSADRPSQEALASKLKTESGYNSLSVQQLNCISGVLLKYAKASDLKDYVEGRKSLEDIRAPENKKDDAEKESAACATSNK